jgi:hypothetical protein
LNVFMKMLKFISQHLALDLDGNHFSKWLKGSKGPWNTFGTIMDSLPFIPSGDYLVVEGTPYGKMAGKSWAGGKIPGGRFCNVSKFRDGRISSVHVYLDPDCTGEDEAPFRWAKNRHW